MSRKLRPATVRAARLALPAAGVALLVALAVVRAADHTDSPLTRADQAADIADVYSFASASDPDNIVLAMTISNVQAAPEIELGRSILDPEVLYQFNVDDDGDAIPEYVIQAFVVGEPENQVLAVRGPSAPPLTGARSRLLEADEVTVPVSTGAEARVAEGDGLRVYAGVRDDPFFFDLARFNAIIAGEETGFRDPGVDTFAGLNVYAIVVEVPVARLGGDASVLSVWGSTYR